jgi:hypothetical protein
MPLRRLYYFEDGTDVYNSHDNPLAFLSPLNFGALKEASEGRREVIESDVGEQHAV